MSRLAAAVSAIAENAPQLEAFRNPGHTVVLAPPGSGKTMLLTARLAHDFAGGALAGPQGAACITMTNEAAGELRRRLDELGVRRRPNLFVGTVHAFALSVIVMPFARATGREFLAVAELASKAEQDAAFDVAFESVLGADADDPHARSTMERARRLCDYSGDPLLGGPEIAALARSYEQNLKDMSRYDFNDVMRYSVEMLGENEWLRRIVVSAFPHFYVDEYQDLPPSLDALVRLLCFDQAANANLLAVGDPDQAIYGFLGTRPEMLRELSARAGVSCVELEVNYRCGDAIVAASLRALGESRTVRGVTKGGEIVIEPPADGPEAQRRLAVNLVRVAEKEGAQLEQILVLAQGGVERDLLAEELRDAGVPTFARSDEHYRATPLTMAIEALANYAAAPRPQGLGSVLDAWEAAVPGRLEHPDLVDTVALLQCADPEAGAFGFVERLTQLGLSALSLDSGGSEDGQQISRLRAALDDGELRELTIRQLGDRARAIGRVMVATLHGAKGLEFDVVIMCDVEEGRMPHWGSIKGGNRADLAEDRRKFYVGLTRARRRVHLVSAAWRISQKGNPYPIELSRFALDLVD